MQCPILPARHVQTIKGGAPAGCACCAASIRFNRSKSDKGRKFPQFWVWSGKPDAAAKGIGLPDMNRTANVATAGSVKING
ncbi:hypothetical protein AABM17_1697 [Neisseria musculi]|uniref:Uncharacterized protein n=1 Tax=Neisseria musculi TaxID=1815583 RepID=A0A7H1M844_9NEIS|nr:hypothetical protein H7A79_1696 [Neisseria musculi]